MVEKRDLQERRREEQRPMEEFGEGEAEGFEQAEEQLREQAENFDEGRNPKYDAGRVEEDGPRGEYGEPDREYSSEDEDDDH